GVNATPHKTPENHGYCEPRWDWVVATLCISIGAFGLRLVNDSEMWNRTVSPSASGASVGTVTSQEGFVRLKPHSTLVWHDLSGVNNSTAVANGDSVFTAETGVAMLSLE